MLALGGPAIHHRLLIEVTGGQHLRRRRPRRRPYLLVGPPGHVRGAGRGRQHRRKPRHQGQDQRRRGQAAHRPDQRRHRHGARPGRCRHRAYLRGHHPRAVHHRMQSTRRRCPSHAHRRPPLPWPDGRGRGRRHHAGHHPGSHQPAARELRDGDRDRRPRRRGPANRHRPRRAPPDPGERPAPRRHHPAHPGQHDAPRTAGARQPPGHNHQPPHHHRTLSGLPLNLTPRSLAVTAAGSRSPLPRDRAPWPAPARQAPAPSSNRHARRSASTARRLFPSSCDVRGLSLWAFC